MKNIKNISKNLATLAFLFLLWGCPNSATQYGTANSEQTKTQTKPESNDRQFDPLEFPQDKEIVPQKYPIGGEIFGSVALLEDSLVQSDSLTYVIPEYVEPVNTQNSQAYRIQIFTAKVYGEIKKELQIAEEIFDQPVFVDYEVPYFKLRVGSFKDKERAQEYQKRVKAAGYKNAWVVMVNVNVKEMPSAYDGEGEVYLENKTRDNDDESLK